ncbi:hypothetical protein BT67DRAFT_199569 [Trichocladium antarcticum]|uniref:Uncharacterized protein n=1 Tax=Trichocladium antarcticum TaxID=1450529 RepID=A0AAN6ZGI0_9PEZI|nr:hypothetical protein BT67DRAFT_199569 [Trichocladium antarcticum]
MAEIRHLRCAWSGKQAARPLPWRPPWQPPWQLHGMAWHGMSRLAEDCNKHPCCMIPSCGRAGQGRAGRVGGRGPHPPCQGIPAVTFNVDRAERPFICIVCISLDHPSEKQREPPSIRQRPRTSPAAYQSLIRAHQTKSNRASHHTALTAAAACPLSPEAITGNVQPTAQPPPPTASKQVL